MSGSISRQAPNYCTLTSDTYLYPSIHPSILKYWQEGPQDFMKGKVCLFHVKLLCGLVIKEKWRQILGCDLTIQILFSHLPILLVWLPPGLATWFKWLGHFCCWKGPANGGALSCSLKSIGLSSCTRDMLSSPPFLQTQLIPKWLQPTFSLLHLLLIITPAEASNMLVLIPQGLGVTLSLEMPPAQNWIMENRSRPRMGRTKPNTVDLIQMFSHS